MGFFDKVKFWKHDEPLDLDSGLPPLDSNQVAPGADLAGIDPGADLDPSLNAHMDLPKQELSPPDFGQSNPDSFQSPLGQGRGPMGRGGNMGSMPGANMSQSLPAGNDLQKDLELMNSKLDAIKSELNSMSQRIMNLERLAQPEDKPKRRDPWSSY